MSAHRFFLTRSLDAEPGAEPGAEVVLALSQADAHHAADVLRICVGEEIDVVEPGGRAWRVRVTNASREAVSARVMRELPDATLPSVTLVQGVVKGDKMDAIVRQATELGASRIVPVLTERSVVKLSTPRAAEKTERWRRIAHAAAKQARRASLPEIAEVATLEDTLAELSAADVAIVAWEECDAGGIARIVRERAGTSGAHVALVVGPEGGLSEREVAALQEVGALTASLGKTILRAETAAVAALAVAIAALEECGSDGE